MKKVIINSILTVSLALGSAGMVFAQTAEPSIKVLSPNGGEVYKTGSPMAISWTSTGLSSNAVNLLLFRVEETQTMYIAKGIENTGSYTWTIPEKLVKGSFKVRVSVLDANGEDNIDNKNSDSSDAPFTILQSYTPVSTYKATEGQQETKQESLEAQKKQEVLQAAREEFNKRVEAAREEFKTKREAAQTELKAKLAKIKDEKKKATVEKLDNRFTETNTKLTNHFLDSLKRLEGLLDKVISRADKAAAKGVDVTAVKAAIEKAKTAIAAAKTAAQTQLTKVYPINVTTDATLKSAVATARGNLNKDLKTLKDSVQKAHQALVEAVRLLKGVPKVDDDNATVPAPEPATNQ